MYRIRLASGEEAVYRTAEELAQAVTSGVVSADADVFHKSADRWLPISLHPDYRAVVTGKRPAVTTQPVAVSGPRPKLQSPEKQALPEVAPPPAAMAPAPPPPPIELPTPALALEPPTVEPPQSVLFPPPSEWHSTTGPLPGDPTRAGRLRVMLALAMGLAAIGLIGGGAFLAWPRASTWLASHRERKAILSEGMSPVVGAPTADSSASAASPMPAVTAATRRLDSIPNLFPAPSKPLANMPSAPDTASPANREETRTSRLTATRTRLPSYFEAYADARSEMDDGFDYVSFRRVFAPSRFAAPESVRATRRMVQAAGNILRVYRGREVMLEQTYRPDDPGGRGSLREPFETAEASRALLADVDSLFGILVSQQGRYSYSGDGVHFQDPRTARTYGHLRSEIVSALADWRDSSVAANRITLPRLLQALGGTAPPPVR